MAADGAEGRQIVWPIITQSTLEQGASSMIFGMMDEPQDDHLVDIPHHLLRQNHHQRQSSGGTVTR